MPKLQKELVAGLVIVVAVGVLLRQLVNIEILEPRREKKARDARTSCQGNFEQIGLAMMQYAQDYNQTIPLAATTSGKENWIEALLPYLHQRAIFHCPSDESGGDSYVFNDAYSARGDGLTSPSGQPLNYIGGAALAQTVLVADGTGDFRLRWELKDGIATKTVNGQLRLGSIIGRHFGKPNILYLDGHSKWSNVQQFMPRTRKGKSYFAALSIEAD